MIFLIDDNQAVDTDSLSPEERHILQKLMAWHSLVDSLARFKMKKEEALKAGWNNSGPVTGSPSFFLILRCLEKKVINRLQDQPEKAHQ